MTWNAVAGVTGYILYRSPTGVSGSYVAMGGGPGVLSKVDMNVHNGQTFYYYVTCYNDAGTSPNSNIATATPDIPAPTLTATAGKAKVTLTWSTHEYATQYKIYRSMTGTQGSFTLIDAPLVSTTTKNDTNVANGNTYYYYAVPYNDASDGTTRSATVSALVKLDAPTGLNACWRNGQITVNWSALADADSYGVYRSFTSGGGYTMRASVTTSSWTDTLVSAGSTYYYYVDARNNAGGSPISAVVPAETVNASIGTFNRVPTGESRPVVITVTANTCSQSPVTLNLRTTTGAGEARFANNSTTMTITGTTTVQITGVTESSVIGNIQLDAKNGDALLATKSLTVFSVNLKEVSFSGTNYHEIYADNGAGPYSAPHWRDGSSQLDNDADDSTDRKRPVAFTRNTKMRATVKWIVRPAGILGGLTVKAKGDGPSNIDIPETVVSFNQEEMGITDVEASAPFANEVDFFDPMEIKWDVTYDAETMLPRYSKNPVYVTLANPANSTNARYHTVIRLSSQNADGQTTVEQATAAIWGEFTDRNVKRVALADPDVGNVAEKQLTYYASYQTVNLHTATLLANGDGQCSSWAKLFIDMLKSQGIENQNEYRLIQPLNTNAAGFLVKNWTYIGSGLSNYPATFPYLNLPAADVIGTTSYNWRFAEVVDAAGVAGQGTVNPASLFSNHQIVYIGGQYYDPSYGLTYASLSDFKTTALDGFYIAILNSVDEPTVNLDLNEDGDMTDTGVQTNVVVIRRNLDGINLEELISDY
ncbi:MAG TPA: hypothetical protein VJ842_14545 [Pyrinomonadaceae bacterium]|nr:hypothetical protein [Pyrinomonadaceae bacterium]